ncbi:glycosyl-4,4'-diaponeurosporenoate acyltransferase CrtO family protein [Arthrobacter pityocampae]|uniref:glycosyl-4,4'-diaponeurosporenoate acyltransferase CrtO family protein n=1 Tax=Arthrobacter pityocampae TaxID=547334 RepID=UPI003736ECF2
MSTTPEQGRAHQTGSIVTGLAIGVGLAIAGWWAIRPDYLVFALSVQGGFLFMGLLAGPALVDAGRSRYRVSAFEPRLYTLLGAELLRRVLDLVGWNRLIRQLRHSETGPSGLARFLRGAEQSETAHLLGAAATLLLAVTAAVMGHTQGSGQILLIGMILHAYPVMIQRIVRYRITTRRANTHTSTNRSTHDQQLP